jgi:RND family efflux transporter MFP subunit
MRALLLSMLTITLLAGCGAEQESGDEAALIVKVRTAQIENAQGQHWTLSGTVQSRHDATLSFLISGQISERLAQAGQQVEAGDVLLRLDPRDIRQQLAAAQANVAAAHAQAENAEANRDRLKSLSQQGMVPAQAFEDARAQARAARQSAKAAEAALAQANSANEYGELKAPADGVLLEVSGEVGQVVTAGVAVATLAYDGPRDIEVFVSERRRADLPERARVELYGREVDADATLREVAGSADPMSRSWRTRYSIEGNPESWPLGNSATLILPVSSNGGSATLQTIPVGAMIDRGEGMGVWVVDEGNVHWQTVELVRMDTEQAYIRSDLDPGTAIVALGAHLLQPDQKVEALP